MSLQREIVELKAIAAHYAKRPRSIRTAVEILHTVGKMQQNIGDKAEMALTLYQIGELHSELQQYDEAQHYYEQAVDIWNRSVPTTMESALGYAEAMMQLQLFHDREQRRSGAPEAISQDEQNAA